MNLDLTSNNPYETIIHIYQTGEQLYKDSCKECYHILNFEKIIKDISLKFPEISLFPNNILFPIDTHPKYYKKNIIDSLSKFYKYDELYIWVSKYWNEVSKEFEEIDQKFDKITITFVEKIIYLEKDPEMQDTFKTLDNIKKEFMEECHKFVKEKIRGGEYTSEDLQIMPRIVMDEILEKLKNNYKTIFKDVCEREKITDPELVKNLFEINGVNRSMFELNFTLDYFIRLLK